MNGERLPAALAAALAERLQACAAEDVAARLWAADATLWKAGDAAHQALIAGALGWLGVFEDVRDQVAELVDFALEVRADGLRDAVLLGMGGSSLAPEVFSLVLGADEDRLALHVLDSTDPAAVLAVEEAVDLDRALFIVASKSGGTTETAAFHAYFHERLQANCGEHAGQHFAAITDEGTSLEQTALDQNFRAVFVNPSDIGGRYSALSYFGLVPAALMGVDLERLLDGVDALAAACGPDVPVAENPAARLGAALGECALRGRDKLTLVCSPSLAPLGAWIEQLVAESTGKEGTGILPVDLEPLAEPALYGDDRVFCHLRLAGDDEPGVAARLDALAAAGHPVLEHELADAYELGGEMLRWELATAIAGLVLGIDPFDQPNVQESKDYTKRLLAVYEAEGALPDLAGEGARVAYPLADEALPGALAAFFAQAAPGDYVALQAYVKPEAAVWQQLQGLRLGLRDGLRVATTLGYGPRYLHSTGQYHKGGPNRGLFLQLAGHDARDAAVPGQPYTFSVLKRAQARGDLAALRAHDCRVLRVCLGDDVPAGLTRLAELLAVAPGDGDRSARLREESFMDIAMLGLGRMGANMARRLLRGGHRVVVWNRTYAKAEELAAEGAEPVRELADVVAALPSPRVIWLMLPHGDPTQEVIDELLPQLAAGDILIDGGNSPFQLDIQRGAALAPHGIRYLDAGTSGGVWGLELGYCLMVGGERSAYDHIEPLLQTLAPAGHGYDYMGGHGSGHFVKMVHNGIEYGLMQAYAEGFELLEATEWDLDLAAIADLWNNGSVVRSWLLELAADAFRKDPGLQGISGYVEDTGEGRWTVEQAIAHSVPLPVIATSLFMRFRSRQDDTFSGKVMAALRKEFGGHAVREKES